ncbi:long-chain-fatty-acid--CoA ligase [uncultured Microscilla sp.]|uniref:long-chain-fatty-acid--CoA ligase n=1 Tax=uncultured Microscilla sp. TaxID=432653 RepID=UPI00262DFE44|nr:long-chain-fatty-acid--CoA ligase [uncultured Microscilla sp.]
MNPDFQTLSDLSAKQAAQIPNEVALIYEDELYTYAQLEQNANRVAQGLLQLGLLPQTRVAILAKDSLASYEILFGCAKSKTVLVTINWRLVAQEALFILNDSQTEVLFVGKEFLPLIEQIKPDLQNVKTIISIEQPDASMEYRDYTSWKNQHSNHSPGLDYLPEDVAVQIYTSGTTGLPKGVQLAHYSFFRLMKGMRAQGDAWMNLNAQDTLLLSLPMFHIGGLWWTIQGMIVGGRGTVLSTFVPWRALELIEQYQITKVAMVPAMIQFCMAEPTFETTNFSSVQGFLYGGSPIAPALLRQAMDALQCGFFQIYGMTETGNMAVCLRPEDHDLSNEARLKAAGKPLPGVEVKITNAQGESLPANQIGEIHLKSPSRMIGYWNRDEATKKTLVDGWISTGDAGYQDEKGYIFVCDRVKDMIIYAGENLFPAEIEAALSEHEAIEEVAVIGIPSEQWGEIPKAFIVQKPGYSLKKREVLSFAKERMADFKVPRSVEFVDKLPRNPSGKVLKRVLREPYWNTMGRQVN